MNKLILMGNFTRDPEIRYSQNDNKAVARFTIHETIWKILYLGGKGV